MPIYMVRTGSDAARAGALEQRIRRAIPGLTMIANVRDILDKSAPGPNQTIYLLAVAPPQDRGYFAKLTEGAAGHRGGIFFVLISEEISASDYKALVRRGDADWVSINADPQEILDVIARHRRRREIEHTGDGGAAVKSTAMAFVSSAGGVGNTTLAVEVAIKLKTGKATRDRNICIIDLDFQGSHVCDHLDIEPRLKIQEILDHPERLDAQLFDIFASRHGSGLHVFAAPRSKIDLCNLNVSALDAFLSLASQRYDLILIDLPPLWFAWSDQVIAASDGLIVTGVNTIPGLRRVVEALAAVRSVARPAGPGTDAGSERIAVAINRCRRRFGGGVADRHHVKTVLRGEAVFYVGEEPAALHSVNAGTPIGLGRPSARFAKEIAAVAAFCVGTKSRRAGSG